MFATGETSEPMELRYFQPCTPLRSWVGSYYFLHTEQPTTLPVWAEFANMRIVLSGHISMTLPDGTVSDFDRTSLIGPTMNWIKLSSKGPVTVFGIGLLPRGWAHLVGIDAETVTNQIVDMEGLYVPTARQFHDRLCDANNDHERRTAADLFLLSISQSSTHRFRAFPDALAAWLSRPHELCIDRLVENLDISRRQTDRVTKMFFGASPKRLQRKYRALYAAGQLATGSALRWSDIDSAPFTDQSHFIKEIKTFTGSTPRQLIMGSNSIMTKSVQLRAALTQLDPNQASGALAGISPKLLLPKKPSSDAA